MMRGSWWLQLWAVQAATCNWNLQIGIVQDASSSYFDFLSSMAESVNLLVTQTKQRFATVHFSLATFIDKPAPFRGVGNGRGHPAQLDYCYRKAMDFTDDPEVIKEHYRTLTGVAGSGGDGPENVYEAMVYASVDSAWAKIEQTPFLGAARVNVIIVATDDLPHYEGDLQQGIRLWNPSALPSDAPHFMDPQFLDHDFGYDAPHIFGGRQDRGAEYDELVDMAVKSNRSRYQDLINTLGPASFKDATPFPDDVTSEETAAGSGPASICATAEYPSLDRVASALQSAQIIPIVIVTRPPFVSRESARVCTEKGLPVNATSPSARDDFLECLMAVYKSDLAQVSPEALVYAYEGSPASLVESLVLSLEELGVNLECSAPSGILRWVAGALASAGVAGCALPGAFRKGVEIETQEVEGSVPETSSSAYTEETSDSCSWTNYI